MAKIKNWKVENEGTMYDISYKSNAWTGKGILTVNGEETEIKSKGFQSMAGIDVPIMIGDKEIRFVRVGSKPDLAVNGVYLDSGKEYHPIGKVPWWSWVFAVLCIFIPIVAMGGGLPFLIGFGGAMVCVRTSVNPKMKTIGKVLLSLGVVILAWILFAVLMVAMGMI